jgi:CheY-like chemotaxis protein
MKQTDKKLTILIADDSPDDQFIFQIAITEIAPEAELIFVYNGAQLVEYFTGMDLESNTRFVMPDVIIADLSMPFYSAFEAMHKIKINTCLNVPMYVFSGVIMGEHLGQTKELGVNGIYRKPNTITELKNILQEILLAI